MAYLYGATDDKCVPSDIETKQKKLKPLDVYKFKLNWLLEGKQKISPYQASIVYQVTPDTLVELASPKVNALPLPKSFQWRTFEVSDWIKKLGYPQYRNTFTKNHINGRTLIRMDASYLTKINIKDFDHIQMITKSIRNLYDLKQSSFSRSISMPDRPLDDLYKYFRVRNGPKYEKTRRTDLYRRLQMLRRSPLYETHWITLERWLKHLRPVDTELIGGIKRFNLYQTKRKPKLSIQPKKKKGCQCIPPCACEWTKAKDLREPWSLKCLNRVALPKEPTTGCTCSEPCTCEWHDQHLRNLRILRVKIPNKYACLKLITLSRGHKTRTLTKGLIHRT